MESPNVTALDLVTLVIAGVGALTGITALGVQVGQYVMSGARVKVSVKAAMIGPGGAITSLGPAAWTSREAAFPSAAVAVEVRNVGRHPATVQGWGVSVAGMTLTPTGLSINKPLPCRLEAGSQETWFADLEMIVTGADAGADVLNRPSRQATAVVSLGDGRRITSGNRIEIPKLAR